MADPSGLIWLSMPRYTVGLVVNCGRVVLSPPPARRWAQGKAKARGADLEWIPNPKENPA